MSSNEQTTPGAAADEIIHHLGSCLRSCTMYDLSHAHVMTHIEKLAASINQASRDGGTIALQAVNDKFFLNKRFVRLSASAYKHSQPLLEIFKRLGINEIAFHAERLEVRQLCEFLEAYKRTVTTNDPGALTRQMFEAVAVRTIDGTEADAFDDKSSPQETLIRQYTLLMVYLGRVSEALRQGQPTRLAGLRRMLQKLAETSEGMEPLLVAVTGLPQTSRHPQAHQVRCAAMTLLMGRKAGLSRAALIDVAFAALFHDIARDDSEPAPEGGAAAANDASRTGADAQEIRQMSLRSILQMCRSGVGLDTHLRLAVAREVWLPLKSAPRPSLAAKLVAVPCAFDLLTRATATRRGLTPDQAMRFMASRAGNRYDLQVLRLFASAIGVYPAGTVIDLSNGSVALVMDGATGSALPKAKLVGQLPVTRQTAPGTPLPGTRPTITRCVDPGERGVNPIHYFTG